MRKDLNDNTGTRTPDTERTTPRTAPDKSGDEQAREGADKAKTAGTDHKGR